MFHIKKLNKISPVGLTTFDRENYTISEEETAEDAIILRSASLHEYAFPESLLSIARAGAGVNNIPLDRCSASGIVVFNAPGANANAVKELVLASMLLSSRDIEASSNWVREQTKTCEVSEVVEKGKSAFRGPELYKKTLGVIGLGAIGALVANIGLSMGMDVYGYDPYLSVNSALRLDRHIHVVSDINDLYQASDYITVHVHYNESTKHMYNAEAISMMKDGVRLINLARGAIGDDDAILSGLESGKISKYVTDFPNNKLMQNPNVIAFPHLGASTPESEENCAVMVAGELKDYLENGNISHSVNFPNVFMVRAGICRVCMIHKNIPSMLANITTLLSSNNINVAKLTNKSRGNYAYTMIDLDQDIANEEVEQLKALNGVIRVRVIRN